MIDSEFRAKWHAYYSEKRIVHQWLQVDLLQSLPAAKVLEIGPYLGLVTAMLASAGYEVTTLDIEPQSHGVGAAAHIQADIRELNPAEIRGFDVILCCETLEHLHWEAVDPVLARLNASAVPWLIISVPYEAFQLGLSVYLNRYLWRRTTSFRKLRFLRRWHIRDHDDWEAHKWEIGYRGYPLSALERKVAAAGFAVERREFTAGCRSVFLVCRNAQADAGA